MAHIAGVVEVSEVFAELHGRRRVFHSEADLQHAFAWSVQRLAPSVKVRLEVPRPASDGRRRAIDLLCLGDRGRTAVELKYIKASWDGADPVTEEPVHLRQHAADDLARHHFVADIARLEQVCAAEQSPTDGLAIMLTNVKAMWTTPVGDRRTRDRNFRIHEGRTLTGTLVWGEGDFPSHDRTLHGVYPVAWQPFSRLAGRNGDFRWLAIPITG